VRAAGIPAARTVIFSEITQKKQPAAAPPGALYFFVLLMTAAGVYAILEANIGKEGWYAKIDRLHV